jgi:hypothetical protein
MKVKITSFNKRSVQLQFLLVFLLGLNCSAQAAGTVGDATTTLPAVGQTEQYGVTSPFSKHQRLGNSSGIGGSYLGTESVTAETRAPIYTNIGGSKAPEVHEPKIHMPTGLEMPTISPGLASIDIRSIGGKSNMTTEFQLRQQSIPNFSFQNRQNPALQETNFGGSSYSMRTFERF